MRLILRAGQAVVSLLDALAALCLGVTLALYGLAWTLSWPFGAAGRRLNALSRRIAEGAP